MLTTTNLEGLISPSTKKLMLMNKLNFFFLVALLFVCNTIFAQMPGGYPVDLKPWNPPVPPPIGGIIRDTTIVYNPLSIDDVISFECYKNSSHLTLQCNEDERVEVVIYEMLSSGCRGNCRNIFLLQVQFLLNENVVPYFQQMKNMKLCQKQT